MATPIAPGAAPKDAAVHPKTLHPSTPSPPRTGPRVWLPMGPRQGWGCVGNFGTPWLHYFPNTWDGKYGKWKQRERDIISPERGLESGIKSPAPPGSCKNATVTAPGSPPAPSGGFPADGHKAGGIIPAAPVWGLGTGPAPGGTRGDGEAAAGTARPLRMLGRNESWDYQRGRGIWFLWPRRC